ncbi:hypothetical protein TNCT_366191 [Trichonephila clavata]|uniref:Uncharacterized protein n=1 Tax=Trichonephila clavata TaxID=2740835 RepID=A0A8X6KQH8_TRICU|nr:hypothetical protein TNCT_366191 [Trichonephila clavata]
MGRADCVVSPKMRDHSIRGGGVMYRANEVHRAQEKHTVLKIYKWPVRYAVLTSNVCGEVLQILWGGAISGGDCHPSPDNTVTHTVQGISTVKRRKPQASLRPGYAVRKDASPLDNPTKTCSCSGVVQDVVPSNWNV